ncbi:glutathione S-transferase family protein [Brevirhabdus sp.]|uniref:glutathione S-transferase family protein n=1 Tax=Brevirhabdus sp. TaxID=2004514 RepID=UPI004057D799
MVTIWGRANSINVQMVMWATAELGLEVERIDAGGVYGGTDTADYRAMNPNGLVPTLRDGDTAIWESGAILRYLAATYGDEGFWPRDPADRAQLDMWAEWMKTTFSPCVNYSIFWQLVRTAAKDRDTARVAAAVEQAKTLSRLLDERIGQGPFLNGDALSFADIAVGVFMYRYHELAFDKADRPALSAYYERLKTRPAFQKHVMVSYEPLRVEGA